MAVLKTGDDAHGVDSVHNTNTETQTQAISKASSDAPPPYPSHTSSTRTLSQSSSSSPSSPTSPSSSSSSSKKALKVPNIPPTNYLIIKRDNAPVRETVVIDPALPLFDPDALAGTTDISNLKRKNLQVECKNGSVNVDVWLLDRRGDGDGLLPVESTGRAEVDVGSKNGSVTVRLYTHSIPTSGTSNAPRPFSLTTRSHNGSVTLAIPRTFTGPITLTSRGNHASQLSPEVRARAVVFSDVDGRRACFIGDVREYVGKDKWTGSIVEAETKNGRIKLEFVDEDSSESSGSGFFGRLFGGGGGGGGKN